MAKSRSTIPSDFIVATMEDFKDRKIVQGTEYYLTNGGGYRFTIRPRLMLGMVIDGIRITNEETEEDYNDNYRKVIVYYINTRQLWIQDTKKH